MGKTTELQRRLAEVFRKDGRALMEATLRIETRFEPPPVVEDFGPKYDPQSFRADLVKRRFEITHAGQTIWAGNSEVVGTFNEADDTFLWAWRNPSTPPASSATVRAQAEAIPDIGALVAAHKFETTQAFSLLLAQWLVHRMGWFGVYAIQTAPIIFL